MNARGTRSRNEAPSCRSGPPGRPRHLGRLVLLTLIPLLFGLVGCAAQKKLIITSTPEGARVRLDDEVIGHTPVEHDFHHYGTRRVTLQLDGYRTHSQRVKIRPPLYGRFPLDLVSEVLLPFGWKDRHVLDVPLEPEIGLVSQPDLEAVLQRAEIFRRATPAGPRFPVESAPEDPAPAEAEAEGEEGSTPEDPGS